MGDLREAGLGLGLRGEKGQRLQLRGPQQLEFRRAEHQAVVPAAGVVVIQDGLVHVFDLVTEDTILDQLTNVWLLLLQPLHKGLPGGFTLDQQAVEQHCRDRGHPAVHDVQRGALHHLPGLSGVQHALAQLFLPCDLIERRLHVLVQHSVPLRAPVKVDQKAKTLQSLPFEVVKQGDDLGRRGGIVGVRRFQHSLTRGAARAAAQRLKDLCSESWVGLQDVQVVRPAHPLHLPNRLRAHQHHSHPDRGVLHHEPLHHHCGEELLLHGGVDEVNRGVDVAACAARHAIEGGHQQFNESLGPAPVPIVLLNVVDQPHLLAEPEPKPRIGTRLRGALPGPRIHCLGRC
eukprot:RCo042060